MRQTAALRLIAQKREFQQALIAWYRKNARDLPWRRNPSLYSTVVSEFMLQQTQVKTALPYFERWMSELPDFAALASASAERVLKLWEGLGYYSRARNLHRLAQVLVALPEIPRTAEAWRELPGIGPYTAAAVASIGFGVPTACVDGNVVRILARILGDATEFRDSTGAAKALAPVAGALMPEASPGDHNQAMMELGATVCTRHNPLCLLCPVRSHCAASEGDPERYPRLAAKSVEKRSVVRVWCVKGGALLMHRAPAKARRLADLHELPTAGHLSIPDAEAERRPLIARRVRGITRFRITESIHVADAPRGALPGGLAWVPINRLDEVSLSGPHRRWIREILDGGGPAKS